jgi:hypothetical protein
LRKEMRVLQVTRWAHGEGWEVCGLRESFAPPSWGEGSRSGCRADGSSRCGGGQRCWYGCGSGGKKTALLRHLYIKCIILPRQARDKHRENSKKVPFSLRVSARCRLSCRQRPQRCSKDSSCATAPPPQLQAARPQRPRRLLLLLLFRLRCCRRCRSCDGPCSRSRRPTVRKTPFICTILYLKNDHFTKTGSGQT